MDEPRSDAGTPLPPTTAPQEIQLPAAPGIAPPAGPSPVDATSPAEAVIASVSGAASWARFLSIVWFVCVGIMGVLGLGLLAFGLPAGQGLPGRFMGLIYLAMSGVYLIPLTALFRFATEGSRLRGAPSLEVAAEALRHNRSFWRRVGILTIIGLSLTVLALIMAILVVAFVAATRS